MQMRQSMYTPNVFNIFEQGINITELQINSLRTSWDEHGTQFLPDLITWLLQTLKPKIPQILVHHQHPHG